jgi:thiamine pyrophosphate-dependent acetolactate synthase large subunit-like protein
MIGPGAANLAIGIHNAHAESVPVVAIVGQVAHDGRYLGVCYGNPDFAEFARLLGAHGERVERDEDLRPALNRALHYARDNGLPAVVNIVQDNHEGLPTDLVPQQRGTGLT